MIEILDEPWPAFVRYCKKHSIRRADILTGFIGKGAEAALAKLDLEARIVIGLASETAHLSAAQIEELKTLSKKHKVRWLPGLHAKVYLLDRAVAIVGSANFTQSGFEKLDEILMATDDAEAVREAAQMFDLRWKKAKKLNPSKLSLLPAGSSGGGAGNSLGTAKKTKSGFSGSKKKKTKKAVGKATTAGDVRLIAALPKWIPDLEAYSHVPWTASQVAPVGQIHIFCITKTGEGADDYSGNPRVDAVHSIWRMISVPKTVKAKGRWPVQADFEKVLVLKKPIPKQKLITAGLVKGRWPQNPAGKLYRGPDLKKLVALLIAANPSQSKKITATLLPS